MKATVFFFLLFLFLALLLQLSSKEEMQLLFFFFYIGWERYSMLEYTVFVKNVCTFYFLKKAEE